MFVHACTQAIVTSTMFELSMLLCTSLSSKPFSIITGLVMKQGCMKDVIKYYSRHV